MQNKIAQLPVLDELTLDKVNHALRLIAGRSVGPPSRLPHSTVTSLQAVGGGGGGSSAAPSTPTPPVPTDDVDYVRFDFGSPDTIWTINHGLNAYPTWITFDLAGNVFGMSGAYDGPNVLVLTSNVPMAGTAIIYL